jgi:hypothetical protein
MLHGGAVLNIGTASPVSGGGVMIDGRDWTHEFWNIDGEIVGVRLKDRCFLNFAGSGVCRIHRKKEVIVRLSVRRIKLHGVHS